MTYWTLLSRYAEQPWSIEFGDYDRDVVQAELRDQRCALPFDHPVPAFFIMKTRTDDRADINAAVDLKNIRCGLQGSRA